MKIFGVEHKNITDKEQIQQEIECKNFFVNLLNKEEKECNFISFEPQTLPDGNCICDMFTRANGNFYEGVSKCDLPLILEFNTSKYVRMTYNVARDEFFRENYTIINQKDEKNNNKFIQNFERRELKGEEINYSAFPSLTNDMYGAIMDYKEAKQEFCKQESSAETFSFDGQNQ